MKILTHVFWAIALALVVGCTQQPATPDSAAADSSSKDSAYLLPQEPDGAHDIVAVRQSASDGDEVLMVGRIGGSVNPWIEGRAAFSIVDESLKACSDIPGDACVTPWDYCCETDKLSDSTALIKVVDDAGEIVQTDARELLPIKELSTVVVRGRAQRDEEGNLTVLANGIYVRE